MTGALFAPLRARFDALTPRERALVAAGAALLIGALVWTEAWRPLETARAEARAEIARLDEAMARARALGDDVAVVETGPSTPAPTVLAATAPAMGLSIQRIEPEGARTRVVLDKAPFDALMRWFEALETEHALRVTALELDRLPEPGYVAARATLEN